METKNIFDDSEDLDILQGIGFSGSGILIKCQGTEYFNLKDFEGLQGNLKRSHPKNLDKLKQSILANGFLFPIFVWKNKIVDGHQRILALESIQEQGISIPAIPVVRINAESEKDARKALLYANTRYGEFDKDELKDWLKCFDDEFKKSLRLVDKELKLDDTIKEHKDKICPHCGEIIG